MSIPKPLVQLNQSFIVLSCIIAFILNHWLLLIPFIVGVITLITKKNPLIQVGKRFLRKPLKDYKLEDRDQQLFNQWIATFCLGFSLLFFQLGFYTIAYSLSVLVVIAAGLALMGYCIGCTIRYRYKMWKFNRVS
ncbi:DUF4395 domain-containing protein [Salipaludibacillus daqingensis]|uniref:DUF4395 domain-containing protein n=1 Tax=Salipaludibacillus daqingensis TaxID=3041001 RepID=UPI0024732122|nr:DUF4395 domain-containing protein [Salipaludibacillus daqingensis]